MGTVTALPGMGAHHPRTTACRDLAKTAAGFVAMTCSMNLTVRSLHHVGQ
jgi:hypothetical protein